MLSKSEAYEILGLEDGSSIELVKSAYKQAAMRTHPDKNPDNEDATAAFQRVGEAYSTLEKYLTRPDPSSRRGPPFGFGGGGADSDGDYDSDDGDYYEDDEEDMYFYMFMFEEMMRGHFGFARGRHARPQPHQSYFRPQTEIQQESPEEYRERMKRSREEQIAAAERRAKAAEARKKKQEEDREKERIKAEDRQKAKVESKKAQAEAQRQKAQNTVRTQQQRAQTLRSGVFAFARSGDAVKVKKGVWEDGVDAAGGEIKKGCADFIKTSPNDPQETLLHIAARNGDSELVEWLDAHSADVEERDSSDFTAFHVALQAGHEPIVKHFFENYPPKESEYDVIYRSPTSTTLLSLALQSREPQVVWMILDNGLATVKDINDGWVSFTSDGASQKQKSKTNAASAEKAADIRDLLKRFGGLTPPATVQDNDSFDSDYANEPPPQKAAPPTQPHFQSDRGRGGAKARGRGRGRR